jgi:uncharacterized membrane protein
LDISVVEKNWRERLSRIISPELPLLFFFEHSSIFSVQGLFAVLELEADHNTMKLPDIRSKTKITFKSTLRCILAVSLFDESILYYVTALLNYCCFFK